MESDLWILKREETSWSTIYQLNCHSKDHAQMDKHNGDSFQTMNKAVVVVVSLFWLQTVMFVLSNFTLKRRQESNRLVVVGWLVYIEN